MIARSLLKNEIDRLDERYLELVYNIVRQFPRVRENLGTQRSETVAKLLQEIAANGGLGIRDPQAWQQEMRQDRALPFRDN